MALILNIETATTVCSVSLCKDGDLLYLKENKQGLNHASLLTVFIEKILKESDLKIADLDAVAVSKGPGSYTGLRIGVATAKGLCYAASLPVISINTLQAMTQLYAIMSKKKTKDNVLFCPMIDARRMEVYTAVFDKKDNVLIKTCAMIINEQSFADLLTDNTMYFWGTGAEKCKKTITHPNAIFIDDLHCSSASMAQLAENAYKQQKFEDLANFEPYYLKDFIPTIPKKKLDV